MVPEVIKNAICWKDRVVVGLDGWLVSSSYSLMFPPILNLDESEVHGSFVDGCVGG